MTQADLGINKDSLNTGAPDLGQIERNLREAIEAEFPFLTPEAKNAILQSRIKIISNTRTPKLIKDDLGEDASKKVKEDLFE